MKQLIRYTSVLGCLALPVAAAAAAPNALVDSEASLRAALEAGKTRIIVTKNASNIMITEPLVYSGSAPLVLRGNGQTIWGDTGNAPILHISRGANLTVAGLNLEGPGGYSISNPGGGKGIFVEIPKDRTGTVSVKLQDVKVSNTGNHGVHISDCDLGDDCGGGQGGGGEGSPASIALNINRVTIDHAGFGKQDADGIRIDDRGDGDIIFRARWSRFMNVGGDGVELDEGNAGSVKVDVRHTDFHANGAYCSDELVPDPIAIDPTCNDDGDPDVDDAWDIDEAGPGGISGSMAFLTLIDNYDEGLDFDSEGEGPDNFVNLRIAHIEASGNADEAIKVSEEGDASVVVNMRQLNVEGDVEVEEENAGDAHTIVSFSTIGDDLKLAEDGEGEGTVRLRGVIIGDELDLSDVEAI